VRSLTELEGLEIVVPGSISNLGPAFDTCAVAVQLYLRVRVLAVLHTGRFETQFVDCAPAGQNRIEVAFRHAQGIRGAAAPGLRVEVRSDIPIGAGLGSSGAATIAGLRLFGEATERLRASESLAMACAIEGHPDNAAACLLGGLTVSCTLDDGRVTSRASRWPSDLRLVVATPDARLPTVVSRRVLPASLALTDAVFNLQRALLLLRALDTGRHEDLREAVRDRWHQPARAALVPGLTEALALDDPAVLGVCLSGSGPSIVALATDGAPRAEALLGGIFHRLGVPCTIRTLEAHQPHEEPS
jgi:homoserine kinase